LAEIAHDDIEDAKRLNAQAIGRAPKITISVDGKEGAPLESVKPGGEIIADFAVESQVLLWIYQNLVRASPIGPDVGGHYYQQHLLYADGQQVDPGGTIPEAEEYIFVNVMPYAGKIERGSSPKSPNGVYQVVAVLAQRQFRDVATVIFGYRTLIQKQIAGARIGRRSDNRNPAIIVKLK